MSNSLLPELRKKVSATNVNELNKSNNNVSLNQTSTSNFNKNWKKELETLKRDKNEYPWIFYVMLKCVVKFGAGSRSLESSIEQILMFGITILVFSTLFFIFSFCFTEDLPQSCATVVTFPFFLFFGLAYEFYRRKLEGDKKSGYPLVVSCLIIFVSSTMYSLVTFAFVICLKIFFTDFFLEPFFNKDFAQLSN